jgi:hypothetical protein
MKPDREHYKGELPMRRVVLVMTLALCGCGYSVRYTRTQTQARVEHHTPAEIEIFLDATPARPVENIGILRAHRSIWGNADTGEAINALRDSAAQSGLDGVHSVVCSGPGRVSDGTCEGVGFLYKK